MHLLKVIFLHIDDLKAIRASKEKVKKLKARIPFLEKSKKNLLRLQTEMIEVDGDTIKYSEEYQSRQQRIATINQEIQHDIPKAIKQEQMAIKPAKKRVNAVYALDKAGVKLQKEQNSVLKAAATKKGRAALAAGEPNTKVQKVLAEIKKAKKRSVITGVTTLAVAVGIEGLMHFGRGDEEQVQNITGVAINDSLTRLNSKDESSSSDTAEENNQFVSEIKSK